MYNIPSTLELEKWATRTWAIQNTQNKFYFDHAQIRPKLILEGAVALLEEYQRLNAAQFLQKKKMQHKGDVGHHKVGVSEVVGFLGHSFIREKKPKSRLLYKFKHIFLVFKQYYTYFYIFFHSSIFFLK